MDTASEALAVSSSEKAFVDMAYMAQLTGKTLRRRAGRRATRRDLPCAQWDLQDGRARPSTCRRPTNTSPATSGASCAGAAGSTAGPCLSPVNVEALTAAQPKDLDARKSRCAWALPGSTRSTSSSSCMRPSTPRTICAQYRGQLFPVYRRVADHGKSTVPTTMWRPTPLTAQPCQRLPHSGGQPEPAGCPYLRHHGGRRRHGAPGAQRQGDHPGRPESSRPSGTLSRTGFGKTRSAANAGTPVQRGNELHPSP